MGLKMVGTQGSEVQKSKMNMLTGLVPLGASEGLCQGLLPASGCLGVPSPLV